jgi:IMP dehydrogenase
MLSDDPKISTDQSATFREFILLPRETRTEHALPEVSLAGQLAEGLPLAIPFMSAAMESVTGSELAIALAQHGGLSVLPAGKVEVQEQIEQIEAVKRFKSGFVEDALTVRPTTRLGELLEMEARTGYSTFPVTDDEGHLLGLITEKKYHPKRDGDLAVAERMIPRSKLVVGSEGMSLSDANDKVFEMGLGVLCVVDEKDRLRSVVFFRDLKNAQRYPDASIDVSKRLRVAAAMSTHAEDLERASLCVKAGADALVIDASDGYSQFMRTTVERAKELGVPVVAGNVVDVDGFCFLAESGADAVKVGIGSGSICTTRRVKAIGRGQATAVRSVARARDAWAQRTGKYIPIISDGGLEGTGDMAVALALGADVLMMGKYFAGFAESPTTSFTKRLPVLFSGQVSDVAVTAKPYWGEASARAKNVRRYQQDDPRTFVIEGEEGYVLFKGSLHEIMPRDLKAIKGTLSSCGCRDLEEFRRDARLERQSLGSQQEGGTSIFRS